MKALSDKVGIPIEQVATTDYAGVTEGVLAGKVDIAMYGPLLVLHRCSVRRKD